MVGFVFDFLFMKLNEKLIAVNLRKAGKSYNEIKRKVKVSKSTLTLWLRDIELTADQKNKLFVETRQINAYRLARINHQKKLKLTEGILKIAKDEAPRLINDRLFLSGLMLYWAEGDKSESREAVKFTNSDPVMIALAMKWFRNICMVPESKFRIALHIHSLFCRSDMEIYWSGITKIPLSRFHKTQIKPTSLKHRKNPLYNGTCAIVINDKNLFRRIKGWRLFCVENI
ncbi:MAG: hypothetical protein WCX69_00820 [Candidatus Paceibacterota bacterium]